MNKKLIPLIVTILAIPASQAATTFSFDTVCFDEGDGNVDSGILDFGSATTANPSVTGLFTLTADFDGDLLDDTLSFSIIATGVGGNASVNGAGFVGVGNPRIDTGETLVYTASIGALTVSTGGAYEASFEGFTGGLFQNTDFPDSPTTDVFTANGVGFLTQDFSVDAADALTIVSNAPAIFTTGIDFEIEVAAVPIPEPSSTALLGLGALGFLVRRRR